MPRTRAACTAKESEFARLVATGTPQVDAFIAVYGDGGMARKTIADRASVLSNRPNVFQQIEKLKKELDKNKMEEVQRDFERKISLIWERIEICKEAGDEAAIARYIDILNKMEGHYKEQDMTNQEQSALHGLSTEELRKIAESVDT